MSGSNALQITDPNASNALAQAPSWADAAQSVAGTASSGVDVLGQWLAAQRAKSAKMGLWNDATGLPTGAGLVNAAGQYGNALLMGTTSPLYHGTTATFAGAPKPGQGGFVWWTPSKEWAGLYGPNVHEMTPDTDLNLINVRGESAADAFNAIKKAGVDVGGLQPPNLGDEDMPADEVHQYLQYTPGLAERIRKAGYDGISHPDIRYGEGTGKAVALVPSQ